MVEATSEQDEKGHTSIFFQIWYNKLAYYKLQITIIFRLKIQKCNHRRTLSTCPYEDKSIFLL